ncbi:Early nodulin-like protein 18 [Hibiscus syriacus]|uniref:Early nodulin-like protein 18 n=2 Tax=Hibiscus syriacus TaxID=106335 RepID=A0A6A3AB89_HIBSY|nr:Early nodulin-like protein 18 [Hibiscus syriacus]
MQLLCRHMRIHRGTVSKRVRRRPAASQENNNNSLSEARITLKLGIESRVSPSNEHNIDLLKDMGYQDTSMEGGADSESTVELLGNCVTMKKLETQNSNKSNKSRTGHGRRSMKEAMVVKRVHQCEICGKTFATGQALGGHKTHHRGGKKGGFRACSFVFVLGALENIGFVANMVSIVLYFHYLLRLDIPTSSNTLTNFLGSACLLSLLGGFISDTYLNRLYTILIFGSLEVIGLSMVTIQAYSKDLQPDITCQKGCVKGKVAVMFYGSLLILSIGTGGVKGALPALGADQFDHKDPKEAKQLGSYFNWYMLSTTFGAMVGVSFVVWVSINEAWYWGFFMGTMAAIVGFIAIGLGKPFYHYPPLGNSPLLRIAQVIVVAVKNRRLQLPENSDELFESNDNDEHHYDEKLPHTNQFRLLDKAAIDPQEISPEPWKVCTVTQIEEVKILTRMLPILASTIIMNTCLAQLQTFSVHQGSLMDPEIFGKKFPSASIPVIPLVFMAFLIPIYEFLVVPFARKITGHPSGITQLQRVGVGLVLSIISMGIAGIIEVKRRDQAIKDPSKPISLFWLSFQYGIFGLADMFSMVGLMEFFYKEAPLRMKSLSTSFAWLSLSFGYFLSGAFVDVINAVTKKIAPSKKGWVEGDKLDDNNLNLFYWFLAALSTLNFIVYLLCASWYKYKDDTTDSEAMPETRGREQIW